MRRLVFDIEADNLLDKITKIHCIVTKNYDTGVTCKYTSAQDEHGTIEEGLQALQSATELIAQNGIGYDIPAIIKLYPWFNPQGKLVDTLIMSRVAYPNLKELDFGLLRKKKIPARMVGRHSLEAWGYRLGFHKGDFGKQENAWDVYTPEMLEYCEQDVAVTVKLYDKLINFHIPKMVFDMEFEIHRICLEQEAFGFPFDMNKAIILHRKLLTQKNILIKEITKELGGAFIYDLGIKVPKRNIKYKDPTKASRMAGAEYSALKVQEFNPNSRTHVGKRLVERLGWKPKEFGKDGNATVDESSLKTMTHPLGAVLREYYMIEKRLGMLCDGRFGWMRLVGNDGAIHGRVNTMGAGTSRCTHSKPNMAQIPSNGVPYGKDCRELFHAPEGWKLFGTDASGLELRMLAHYMSRWDKGAYGKIILEGDIHTANQEAAGLPTRNNAKTFIYAFLYGAGDEKIGSIVGAGRQRGKKLKADFFAKTPAIKNLVEAVQSVAKRQGFVRGLDGRTIPVRSAHSALNFLLQGAGAIVCKTWVVQIHKILKERGYTHGVEFKQAAFVHDELQILFRPDLLDSKELKQISAGAMTRTQEILKVRIRLDVDSDIGNNYAETH